MKVYVISLRRATERRTYMHKQLTLLGLEFEIVDAVDYLEMTPSDYAELTNQEAVAANPYLTKGLIACALSHAKVSRIIANSGAKTALVLEDDAQLPEDITNILALVEEQIQAGEVISLCYYSHFDTPVELSLQNTKKLANGSSLFYPANLHNIGSAMAYVITNEASTKLPAAIEPVRVYPDYWGDHFQKGGFTSFRCLYPVSLIAADFRSTLDYSSNKPATRRIAEAALGGLAAFVRLTKFPLLFNYLKKRDKARLETRNNIHFVDAKPFNAN